MTLPAGEAPILLVGAGRLGGALIDGWLAAPGFDPADAWVRTRSRNPAADRALAAGLRLDPTAIDLAAVRTVVLAVKPQGLATAAAELAPRLAPDAVIVSLLVGVVAADVATAFGGRRTARAMPTTAIAIGRGVTTLFAADATALSRARAVFAPVSTLVEIADEALMYPATAVSGSAPGYLYAFVEALEAAGVAAGLPVETSARLVRATIAGAAELMAVTRADPADLRRQVASPGGTTQAALEVMAGGADGATGLPALMREAVAANIARARVLAAAAAR